MQYKDVIKAIFQYEQEDSKEETHIMSLEQKILSQVRDEQKIPASPPMTSWYQRVPVAFAMIAIFLVVGTATVAATENPIKDMIVQITERLQKAAEDALKNGETTVDHHGERIFTGKTAEEMEKLHRDAQKQIKELKARPAAERAKTIEVLKVWVNEYLYTAPGMPKQDSFEYVGIVGLDDDPTHHVEIYRTHDYDYQIDPETNQIYDVYVRGARAKDDPEKTYMDMTPRYNQDELEQKAIAFVKTQLPDVDLSKLTFEKGSKIDTYFFTWKGTEAMKRSTKDPNGYQLCGDVSNPEATL